MRKNEIILTLLIIYGGVAQLGEHLPCKQGVRSSNLLISTNDLTEIFDFVVGQMNIENRITVYISGQETKGARRMPWHQEATKDVTSNENLE